MKINQLFKAIIPDDLILKIVNAFGFRDINDDIHIFTKADLQKIKTLETMKGLIQELHKYYIPCKGRIYLDNLDINKCITILRQILKLAGKSLQSSQRYIKHKKNTIYFIENNGKGHEKNVKIEIDQKTIISFV